VISERTARTHVSNILGKLGVTSRTQAALLAIRDGIAQAPPAS
jgi:DNA-binding NarL/FixJ family response regulator